MAQKSIHVVACAEGWAVEQNGAQVSVRHTRAQAEQIARAFATGDHTEVVVYGRNGRIERKRDDRSEPTRIRSY